jgi:hypothetical protein
MYQEVFPNLPPVTLRDRGRPGSMSLAGSVRTMNPKRSPCWSIMSLRKRRVEPSSAASDHSSAPSAQKVNFRTPLTARSKLALPGDEPMPASQTKERGTPEGAAGAGAVVHSMDERPSVARTSRLSRATGTEE